MRPVEDLPKLLRLRTEIEEFDQHGTDTSEANLKRQFAWPNHDPSQERWVFEEEGGMLIGYGWTFSQSPARSILELFVHPDWRRKGLGTQLLKVIIQYAKNKGAVQIVSGARRNNEIGPLFLSANNFEPVGNNRFFVAPSKTQIDNPKWPSGFSVKTFQELGSLQYLVDGSNCCYADMWGHRENTEPATVAHLEERMKSYPENYYLDGIFVVFNNNYEVVGICFNRLEENQQKRVIDSPGLAPQYRNVGLLRPLVQTSMMWLQGRAAGDYHLYSWGDSIDAVQVYEKLGFYLSDEEHLVEYLLKA